MITIIQKPNQFTPASNPVIFQLTSDNPDIVYFRVEIIDTDSLSVINFLDIYVTPDYPTGSYMNITRILQNLVRWELNNSQNLLAYPVTNPIHSFKINIIERGIVNGMIEDLDEATTLPDTFYVWNAELDRITFGSFKPIDYIVSQGLPAKFLTTKPNNVVVNDYSFEQLYFIQNANSNLNVVVNTHSSSNTLLNTYTAAINELESKYMFRIQVSPKALESSLLVNFQNVDYYTVYLESGGIIRSETRKYFYKKLDCHLEPVNLLFVNQLGGVDSYQFVNPVEIINYTKNTYKKNVYKIDAGYYSYYRSRSGDIINADEEIIDIKAQGNYTATSRNLSDAESQWLHELFNSKQVFVELADTSLVPVMVTDNSYQVQRQKYNKTSFNTVQVHYTMTDGLIPKDAIAYDAGFGNGSMQVKFIDEQMNSDIEYDTILYYNLDVQDAKEGVNGTVAAIDDIMIFEFNKVNPRIGLPNSMNIHIAGELIMVIDYFADYAGKEFRVTNSNGNQYVGTFTNGNFYF